MDNIMHNILCFLPDLSSTEIWKIITATESCLFVFIWRAWKLTPLTEAMAYMADIGRSIKFKMNLNFSERKIW